MRILTFILLFFTSSFSYSFTKVIDVGIFWDNRPTTVVFAPSNGIYDIIADGFDISDLETGESVELSVKENRVMVRMDGKRIGSYQKVQLIKKGRTSTFKIRSVSPFLNNRIYDDNLFVSVLWGRLKLINNVNIENYVAGVVESEAGANQTYEYYRVQAIICRTYALKNLGKYKELGFNLCDRVNSQVYKSKSTHNGDIIKAVYDTKGVVIVDSDINLITAVFHSNSGGSTVNSEDVWSRDLPYLRAIVDTFSQGQPHYEWTHFIPKNEWFSYLQSKYNFPINEDKYIRVATDFCPKDRRNYLTEDGKVELIKLRNDLKLKSTFFCITEKDDYVFFNGKGFGHGVGLSQEGAMKMANSGYTYKEILHYYYRDIHLVQLSALDFFRAE